MNLAEILHAQALQRPDAPAIMDTVRGGERRLTFAALERATERAAALLRESGLQAGDTVLIIQPMSAELYIALGAVFRLGLVAMFLDPSAGIEHIERCCAVRRPDALIACGKAHLLRLRSRALRRIPLAFAIGGFVPGAIPWRRADGMSPYRRILPCPPDTPALLTFTSGSTGEPRAAIRTHGFLLAQHHALDRSLGLHRGEISMMTLPVVVLANLASGVTTLIPDADLRRPGSIDPAPVLRQLEAHGVHWAAGSPALFERLAEECERTGGDMHSLRRMVLGGAPIFPRLLERLQALSPDAEIVAVYGSTEAEPIAHIAWSDMTEADMANTAAGKGLLAGIPIEDVELRIVRDRWGQPCVPWTEDELEAESLPPCMPGEIVVAGDHVLTGYLGGRGDLDTKIQVEERVWHRTGDAGYVDNRGRLWLLGRCSARIEDGRGVLYPFTVECAISGLPRVRRSAVARHHGRRILALEMDGRAGHPNLAEVERIVGREIDEIHCYDRLPVDGRHNAKIDYPALARLLR